MVVCRHCGTRNPDDFEQCASCGATLGSRAASEPTIIDVSDDRAEIVTGEEERTRTFQGTFVGPARVYVTGGGSRSCLILIVIGVLAACCVCVGWWMVAENIFF